MKWLVDELAKSGVRLILQEGKIHAIPPGKLTQQQKALLSQHRDELLRHLGGLPDDVVTAMAERAFFDPPDFSNSPVQERTSVIVTCPGFPVMVLSPEQEQMWLAHNEQAKEKADRKAHKKKGRKVSD